MAGGSSSDLRVLCLQACRGWSTPCQRCAQDGGSGTQGACALVSLLSWLPRQLCLTGAAYCTLCVSCGCLLQVHPPAG